MTGWDLNEKSLGNVLLSSEVKPEIPAGMTTGVKNKGRLPRFARNDEQSDLNEKSHGHVPTLLAGYTGDT